MSTFSKGDRVEYHATDPDTNTPSLEGHVGTVAAFDAFAGVEVDWDDRAARDIRRGGILPCNLRKVEPEFVVGQQVKDEDYERLPVGSKVTLQRAGRPGDGDSLTKADETGWDDGSGDGYIRNEGLSVSRTLTHLGDGTHAEPEDTDDVEPEPLKEVAEPAFNDDDVHHLKVISGSTTVFDGLAVFEEADNGNINVTPVPRCTSLFEKAGSILRCGQHEGHADGHWTIGSTPAASWSDKRACGRLVESDGAS